MFLIVQLSGTIPELNIRLNSLTYIGVIILIVDFICSLTILSSPGNLLL